LRSFWYHFYLYLTSCSTAGVSYYPQDMGALLSLNVADNRLGGLVDSANNVWSFSSNKWWCNGEIPPAGNKEGYKDANPLGVIALANVLPDMGALSELIFGGDKYRGKIDGKWQDIYPEPAVLTLGLTEADFSNKNLGAGGAIIISAWITHKDKGALTKLDISNINIEQGEALQGITDLCNTKGIAMSRTPA
jgi:hypothetical protein